MTKQLSFKEMQVGKNYHIDVLYDLCSKAADIEGVYYDTFMNSITSEDVIEVKGGELRFTKVRKDYLKLIYKYENDIEDEEDDDNDIDDEEYDDVACIGEEDFLRRLDEGEFDESYIYPNF